jgi:proteasome alpha subunit
MGGQSDALGAFLKDKYPKKLPALAAAIKLGRDALVSEEGKDLPAQAIEAAVLDRTRGRRKFRRLTEDEL